MKRTPRPTPPPRLLWDRHEAAARLNVCLTTLDKLIRAGELDVVKIGTRRLVPDDVLLEFIARRRASR